MPVTTVVVLTVQPLDEADMELLTPLAEEVWQDSVDELDAIVGVEPRPEVGTDDDVELVGGT